MTRTHVTGMAGRALSVGVGITIVIARGGAAQSVSTTALNTPCVRAAEVVGAVPRSEFHMMANRITPTYGGSGSPSVCRRIGIVIFDQGESGAPSCRSDREYCPTPELLVTRDDAMPAIHRFPNDWGVFRYIKNLLFATLRDHGYEPVEVSLEDLEHPNFPRPELANGLRLNFGQLPRRSTPGTLPSAHTRHDVGTMLFVGVGRLPGEVRDGLTRFAWTGGSYGLIARHQEQRAYVYSTLQIFGSFLDSETDCTDDAGRARYVNDLPSDTTCNPTRSWVFMTQPVDLGGIHSLDASFYSESPEPYTTAQVQMFTELVVLMAADPIRRLNIPFRFLDFEGGKVVGEGVRFGDSRQTASAAR